MGYGFDRCDFVIAAADTSEYLPGIQVWLGSNALRPVGHAPVMLPSPRR
jgi:hypothetical protein